MKKIFLHALSNCIRKVVVHEVLDSKHIFEQLKENDMLFLDDCLYSQYLFLKDYNDLLVEKRIVCVLGFSANIYRRNGKPIKNAICAECHDKFHANDMSALQAYMTLEELNELLNNDNAYLACHGYNHLLLEKLSDDKYIQLKLFADDIKKAKTLLDKFNLLTNIFVFPYAYDNFMLSEDIVKKYGYQYVFAGKNTQRTEI